MLKKYPKRYMDSRLTENAKSAIKKAHDLSTQFNAPYGEGILIFLAISQQEGSLGELILKNAKITSAEIENQFKRLFNKNSTVKNQQTIQNLIAKAAAIASKFDYSYIGTEHLLMALIETKHPLIRGLSKGKRLTARTVRAHFNKSGFLPNLPFAENPMPLNRSKQKSKKSDTPHLDDFCLNINDYVQKENLKIIGRKNELERLLNVLGRREKNNPLLIGEPGVGKTALVNKLAQKINSGAVSAELSKKTILSVDLASIVAGTAFRGEFESRLKSIISEASQSKNVILFIDEIHNIVGAGNISGSLDAANILKPALSQGEIQVIGATTSSEYKKYFEKDSALERRFQPVFLKEPTKKEAVEILSGSKNRYESFHSLLVPKEVIKKAVELSKRYLPERFLPDKAFDVIDETAARLRNELTNQSKNAQIQKIKRELIAIEEEKESLISRDQFEKALNLRKKQAAIEKKLKQLLEITEERSKDKRAIRIADIIKTVSLLSGIPKEQISSDPSKKAINIKKELKKEVIGQEKAIENISNAIIRSQAGISSKDRPVGSFLFLGPTGVGKTLTAQVLGRVFFQDPNAFIRVDMSEFMEKHNIAKLIGAPAGYVGYGEGGTLTEKVRRQPWSIVLFDEIEKAHSQVANILLQILEDGTLSDASGQNVSFKNCIVILTSNIGTDAFTKAAGKIGFKENNTKKLEEDFKSIQREVISKLQKTLAPELINRLDNVIVFNPLGKKELKKITRLELKKLKNRLKENKITLSFDKSVIEFVVRKSSNTRNGARLIKRVIQNTIEQKIAEFIVSSSKKPLSIKMAVKNREITIS